MAVATVVVSGRLEPRLLAAPSGPGEAPVGPRTADPRRLLPATGSALIVWPVTPIRPRDGVWGDTERYDDVH